MNSGPLTVAIRGLETATTARRKPPSQRPLWRAVATCSSTAGDRASIANYPLRAWSPKMRSRRLHSGANQM